MSVSRRFADLPELRLAPDDENSGRIAMLQCAASRAHGPVLRSVVPSGALAGPCACLVGGKALRFAYGPGSVFLGSAQGWLPLIGRRFGSAVLNTDDPAHAAQRHRWTPAFASRALARCIPDIDAAIGRRVDRWADAGDIDAYAAARALAFAAVASTLGGLPDDAALDALGLRFAEALAAPHAGEDLASHHARVLPHRDAIEHALIERIESARRRRDAPATGSLVALLLEDGPAADTASLLHALNILLVAGHETSASLLAWVLLLAGGDPVWRDRLAREATALPTGAVEAGMLATLPAHDAFIAEAGRLHPPLVNVPRAATRAFDYAGVRIAAGTTVALAIGATDRDADRHAEPNAFRPERFLGDRSENPAHLFTFGHGARTCLGLRFTQLALKLTMVRVLQIATPVGVDASLPVHAGFWNARPRGNVRLRLERR